MQKIISLLLICLIAIPFVPVHSNAAGNQLIIVNKSINKLSFYENGVLIRHFPVATGRTSTLTPEGTFKVIVKWKNPIYYKYGIKGGDPNNPLGDRWIGINATRDGYTYGIHGTNNESSIGSNASSGCVRMYNSDVRWLFERVENGAEVQIIHAPEVQETEMTPITESVYKVKPGDSLWSISQRSGIYIEKIKIKNGLESNTIYSGQELYVHGNPPYHTVRKGDFLPHLSKVYGISTKELMTKNRLHSVIIREGMELNL